MSQRIGEYVYATSCREVNRTLRNAGIDNIQVLKQNGRYQLLKFGAHAKIGVIGADPQYVRTLHHLTLEEWVRVARDFQQN